MSGPLDKDRVKGRIGVDDSTGSSGVVVFACPHGVGMSRMAAALFEAGIREVRLSGWSATTAAGEEPGEALNPQVALLLAGTPAQTFVQPGPGSPLGDVVPDAGTGVGTRRVLVVGIDLHTLGACVDLSWRLRNHDLDEQTRDEISERVAELVETLCPTCTAGQHSETTSTQ